MKLLITIICVLNVSIILSQELPKDALDANTVLIFNPAAAVDNNEETLNYFSQKIIENGFNLVGKHMHSTSQVSLKEIEFDIENKDVKYVFLLTYKFYKAPDYDLFFFEKGTDKNSSIMNPQNVILKLKPGFITSKNVRGVIIKKLEKEVEKLKAAHSDIDTKEYDSDVIETVLLTEENIKHLNDLNDTNTIVDGSTLQIEHQKIPDDLTSSTLAIIAASKTEYAHYKALNGYLKGGLKKYPHKFSFFDTYEDYQKKGGDDSFEYRLQLTKSNVSFLSAHGLRYTTVGPNGERGLSGKSANATSSLGTRPINYQKDLFTVILRDNSNNERYIVSDTDFVGRALKNFMSQL